MPLLLIYVNTPRTRTLFNLLIEFVLVMFTQRLIVQCLLLAQSRNRVTAVPCPLLGAKRTSQFDRDASAYDPKRTLARPKFSSKASPKSISGYPVDCNISGCDNGFGSDMAAVAVTK
jgi:hypothetical protein